MILNSSPWMGKTWHSELKIQFGLTGNVNYYTISVSFKQSWKTINKRDSKYLMQNSKECKIK